jgi:hypothetical protein
MNVERRFRITLARIPLGEFITSINPKLLCNLRVFLFFPLVNMNIERRFRITLARIPLGGVHRKHKPKIAVQFAGIFVFPAYQHKC